MGITKKFDRAFQWAGEKMGSEQKTNMSDDFQMLETEMALRYDGMDRLHKSMNAYVKWLGRRGETFEDKEKGLPVSYLGRTMNSHAEDFEPDSEFGRCLSSMGQANERISIIQETYVSDATNSWLESLERSLAMIKEYQASRKKLENRRLAYDASINKMQKARRDDFRIEEEVRTAKAKYEESNEDVFRRMQDIKDAEVDSVRDITHFLDAELEYHERCADELRRARQEWPGSLSRSNSSLDRRPTGRSRANTARSFNDRLSRTQSVSEAYEPEPDTLRLPTRSSSRLSAQPLTSPRAAPDMPSRPVIDRSNTFQSAERERIGGQRPSISGASSTSRYDRHDSYDSNNSLSASNVAALRGQLRPTSRIMTARDDVFGEHDDDSASGSGSPEWGERSASPATSYGSLSRSTSNLTAAPVTLSNGARKAPPPPPPSRSKKPPPPVPAKREVGYERY